MPRRSERAQVLKDIDAAIEIAACSYLFDDVEEKEEEKEHIQSLCAVQEVIAAHGYLSRDTNAGRHEIDTLEAYIREYPESAFLALFSMHRTSFWHLVEVLLRY